MMRTAGLQDVVDELVGAGFKKRTGLLFTIDLAPDFMGWVGLNTATKHMQTGHVEIHTNVAIRHHPTENLIADLCREKRHSYSPATLSAPLYTLIDPRKYLTWHIDPDDAKVAAGDLARAVKDVGVPWMKRWANLADLCGGLDQERGVGGRVLYTRPVAWMLNDDAPKALTILEEDERRLAQRTDLAADRFRGFAAELRGRLMPDLR